MLPNPVPQPPRHKSGSLPHGWQWVRLGTVAELNPRRPAALNRADGAPTTFVPMSAVDEVGGVVARPELRPFVEVKKGYTYFAEGDVLFAKITPCMQNGKHAIARDLTDGIGFGSTEFHVIRPRPAITAEWIHLYVRQPSVLLAATAHFTGAVGQQRVPDYFLEELEIPLPPLAEQRRIARIVMDQLAAVHRARQAAEEQRQTARQLVPAYLRAMLCNPRAQSWPRRSLGDVCHIVADQVDPRLPCFGRMPHVNGENIESGTCRLLWLNTAEEDGMTSGKYLFSAGDVLYSKLRPYLRKALVVDFAGVCSADMYPIRVDAGLLDAHFLAWTLVGDEFTQYADRQSRRARMPKLNRDQLFAWKIPCPSLDQQRSLVGSFRANARVAQRLELAVAGQCETIDALPAAILRQAFSGGI